ncbi:cation-transporting P-type ATPase [Rhizobiales bacterium]|uniref:cation-translocating P-type ATPase n=1 Tax=Hongsoonwoonella zoysiae TaxID=2821844 RepID=UPI00155F9DF3|nr:cation-transporting P-type ATPase [Hongsoonwoonella zoysiae]NRG16930.1 cation-transporting P-type ATPase [Hongsoonwoonella zoysiae]
MDQELKAPFALEAEEVAGNLAAAPETGLASREVERRLGVYGPNRLRREEAKSALRILANQFKSIIVWLLVAAAALSFVLGDFAEGIAIVVVLLLNGAIGFFTELRATRSMEALMRLTEVRTRVRRDGKLREVDAHELVPGDIVVLEAGDIVTADLRIFKASNLRCDESLLTGESVPVTKDISTLAPDTVIGDRLNMAFGGTAVTQGTGEGIAVATGMETELGRISALAQTADSESSPLERRLDRLGQKLVWLTLALAALTSIAGILRGHQIADMVQTGVALAVAAIPEGLPVVATLSLARGMWRMAKRNAIITHLSSVETLGATTLIVTDKTGTLTENRMTVTGYFLAERDVKAESSNGKIGFSAGTDTLDPEKDAALSKALAIGVLCNTAELGDGSDGSVTGDPMEIALLKAASGAGMTRASLAERFREVKRYAFDPDRKMMATVHTGEGGNLYAVKGAPEAVIEVCDRVLTDEGDEAIDDGDREHWIERNGRAAKDGLRLIALAMKSAKSETDNPYEGLTLVALVCFLDPLRKDVPAAIKASREAGVRVVMLTGDHAETAANIAKQAGLASSALSVFTGRELVDLDPRNTDPELRERLSNADVFARVAPDTKLKLVSLFQDNGHVVAMTGDGVNDAPALRKADIGIAMGQRGTQVAREAADMVLKDDAFSTIIAAMRQGRIIFENIRRFVIYLMSCNVSEVLLVGIAVGAGLPVPLLPLQILFLNLVTDVFPAFALGLGRGEEGIMRQPPRDPREPIVDARRWALIGALGVTIMGATLGAFALALFLFGLEPAEAVTVAFVTLALAQLWNVFNVRRAAQGVFLNDITRNPYVWGALGLCLGLVALAIWHPGLSAILGLPSPGAEGLLLAGVMSLLPLAIGQAGLVVSSLFGGEVTPKPVPSDV